MLTWASDRASKPLVPAAVVALAFILIPFGVAIRIWTQCGGLRKDGSGRRCTQRRRGFGYHCKHHPGPNLYDLLGAISVAVGLLLVWVLPRLVHAA